MSFLHSDCPVDILSLPSLPSTVTCHLQKSCTAVDCCVEPPLIGRSFQAELSLDTCDFELLVRLENKKVKIPLFFYVWGVEESVGLNGFLNLKWVEYCIKLACIPSEVNYFHWNFTNLVEYDICVPIILYWPCLINFQFSLLLMSFLS